MPYHNRYREYIRANQVRKYDGINALYNIINALKFAHGVGEKKYYDQIWTELCEQAGPWPDILWEGIPPPTVFSLLHFAVHRLNTMPIQFRGTRKLAYERVPLPVCSGGKLFRHMKTMFDPTKGECMFLKTAIPWDNWPTLGFVAGTVSESEFRIHLFDAYRAETPAFASQYTSDIDAVDPFAIKPKRLVDPEWAFIIRRV